MKLVEAQQAGIAPWGNQVDEKTATVVYLDKYPCTPGHRLYVPKDNDNPNWVVRAFEDALGRWYTHGHIKVNAMLSILGSMVVLPQGRP
jgi:hypothetical protein